MNWARLKTFLIVLFSVINVFLIVTKIATEHNTKLIPRQTIIDTVSILKQNGIFVDESIIPDKVKNLKEISVKSVTRSDNFLKDITQTEGINFVMDVQNGVSTDKEMKRILKSEGFKDYNITKSFSQSEGKAEQMVNGYRIFGSEISIKSDGTKSEISGVWFEPISEPDEIKDKNIVVLPSILINYISNELRPMEKHSIKKIEYGYHIMYTGPDAVLYTAVPCWRFELDNDMDFYYDARTGEYINMEV